MPGTVENQWDRAIASLRDVTRWIIAGITGAVALIVGTSPLTGLGGLALSDTRLWLAVIGAFVGLVALWFPFRAAVEVLSASLLDIQELANAVDPRGIRLRQIVDTRVDHHLPKRFPDLKALSEAETELRRKLQQPGAFDNDGNIIDPEAASLNNELSLYIGTTVDIARFELVKLQFGNFCQMLFWFIPIAVVGFGIFAWSSHPVNSLASSREKEIGVHGTIDLRFPWDR